MFLTILISTYLWSLPSISSNHYFLDPSALYSTLILRPVFLGFQNLYSTLWFRTEPLRIRSWFWRDPISSALFLLFLFSTSQSLILESLPQQEFGLIYLRAYSGGQLSFLAVATSTVRLLSLYLSVLNFPSLALANLGHLCFHGSQKYSRISAAKSLD